MKLNPHVFAETRESKERKIKPQEGSFPRIAARSRNDSHGLQAGELPCWGFFFGACRTPHVSSAPESAAREKRPASLHPTARRANLSEVSRKTSGQVVKTNRTSTNRLAWPVGGGWMQHINHPRRCESSAIHPWGTYA